MSSTDLLSTEESDFSGDDDIADPYFVQSSQSKKRKSDGESCTFVKKSKLFETKTLFNHEYFRDLEHVSCLSTRDVFKYGETMHTKYLQ